MNVVTSSSGVHLVLVLYSVMENITGEQFDMQVSMPILVEQLAEEMTWSLLLIPSFFFSREGYHGKAIRYSSVAVTLSCYPFMFNK